MMDNLRNRTAILRDVFVAIEPHSLTIPNVGAMSRGFHKHAENVPGIESIEALQMSSFIAGREAVLDEAKKEAMAAGFSSGYEDGYQKGLAASTNDLEEKFHQKSSENVAMLSKLQQQMRQQFVKRLDAIEDDASEIIFSLVAKILGESVHKAENIQHMVQQTISEIRHRPILKVRLHPDDYALITSSSAASTRLDEQFLWQPDETISLGGCVVETAYGELDARFETQLAMLKELLLRVRSSRNLELGS